MIPQFPPHQAQYGALDTYLRAARWLDGHGTVYDWGCGYQFARQFFTASPYVGIDGMVDGLDLATVKVDCDSILMRHILENNPEDWQAILRNALWSFRRRMVLVTFMPFAGETHISKVEQYETGPLSYLRLRKRDVTDILGNLLVRDEAVQTTHSEHVFYLEK